MELWLLVLAATTATAQDSYNPFLRGLMSGLSDMPVIGNVLRASVHPLYQPLVNPILPRINSREGEDEVNEHCFGDLGCITTDSDFFHPIHRPVNLPPYPREQINVLFTVHTREDREGTVVEALDLPKIANTTFTPERMTKILIHGFLDGSFVTWMLDMVRNLLAYDDYNVVTVDWSGGSRALYSQATANTRLVGLEVAHLIKYLNTTMGLHPQDVHIIGHSLGSHTAGYAGEQVPGLGRITGLDPAEPFFQYLPPRVRLDPSDAVFVDVIHTDMDSIFSLGYGLEQQVGHLDFYPNGGRQQPGCDSLSRIPLTALTDGQDFLEGLDAAQKEFVACSHNRAPKLFTDSILSTCPYLAFECSSYDSYMAGKCHTCGDDGTRCAPMGLHADSWQGNKSDPVKVYVSTTTGPHYCVYHYLVKVKLAAPKGFHGSLRGRLALSLITEDGKLRDFALTPRSAETYERGGTYTFFVSHTEDLSSSQDALVHWTYEADMFNPLSYCVLFCDSTLPLAYVSVTTLEGAGTRFRESGKSGRSPEVVMCHRQGEDMILVNSEESVKIVALPSCLNIKQHETKPDIANQTIDFINAGISGITSLFS